MSKRFDNLIGDLEGAAYSADVDRQEADRAKRQRESDLYRQSRRFQPISAAAQGTAEYLGRIATRSREVAGVRENAQPAIPSLLALAPADTATLPWGALYRKACSWRDEDAADVGLVRTSDALRQAFLANAKGVATVGELEEIYRAAMLDDPSSAAGDLLEEAALFGSKKHRSAQMLENLDKPVDDQENSDELDEIFGADEGEDDGVHGHDEPHSEEEEAEFPEHDEASEMAVEMPSPVSGEMLVIELGLAESEDLDEDSVRSLPYVAQLAQVMDDVGLDDDVDGIGSDEGDLDQEQDVFSADDVGEDDMAGVSVGQIRDPASQQMLEVTLRPTGEPPVPDDADEPAEMYEAYLSEGDARGFDPAWRGEASIAAQAWALAAKAVGAPRTASIRGYDNTLAQSAWIVWNNGQNRLHVVAVDPKVADAQRRTASKTGQAAEKLSQEDLSNHARNIGLTAEKVERDLMRKGHVTRGGAELRVTSDGLFAELSAGPRRRRASLEKLDILLNEFILAGVREEAVSFRRKASLTNDKFGGSASGTSILEVDCYACGHRSAWLSRSDEFPCNDCGMPVDAFEAEDQLRARRRAGFEPLWLVEARIPSSDQDEGMVRARRVARAIQALAPGARAAYRPKEQVVVAEIRAQESRITRILDELNCRFGIERSSARIGGQEVADIEAGANENSVDAAEVRDAAGVPNMSAVATQRSAQAAPTDPVSAPAMPAPAVSLPAATQTLLPDDRERIMTAARYYRAVMGVPELEALVSVMTASPNIGEKAIDRVAPEEDSPLRDAASQEIMDLVKQVYTEPLAEAGMPLMPGAVSPGAVPQLPGGLDAEMPLLEPGNVDDVDLGLSPLDEGVDKGEAESVDDFEDADDLDEELEQK